MERKRAFADIARLLEAAGILVTSEQAHNKWKALLKRFRATKDAGPTRRADRQRTNSEPKDIYHEEMPSIMGWKGLNTTRKYCWLLDR